MFYKLFCDLFFVFRVLTVIFTGFLFQFCLLFLCHYSVVFVIKIECTFIFILFILPFAQLKENFA